MVVPANHANCPNEPRPTPENMFTSTSTNHFITWEGEAPAEPLRRQLGRSLALPLFFKRLGIAKMFIGVVSLSPLVSSRFGSLGKIG